MREQLARFVRYSNFMILFEIGFLLSQATESFGILRFQVTLLGGGSLLKRLMLDFFLSLLWFS